MTNSKESEYQLHNIPSQLRPPSVIRPSGPTTAAAVSSGRHLWMGILTGSESDIDSLGTKLATHGQSSFICKIFVPAVLSNQNCNGQTC